MCPFIDKAEARCSDHLTLRNVSRAFAHCANRYTACPVYQKLFADKTNHERVAKISGLLAAS